MSLVTTALIKHGAFDEELRPQEQPHKHNEVTVHMFRPLKSCQDFCSSRFMIFLTVFKGIVHLEMKILSSFMLRLYVGYNNDRNVKCNNSFLTCYCYFYFILFILQYVNNSCYVNIICFIFILPLFKSKNFIIF